MGRRLAFSRSTYAAGTGVRSAPSVPQHGPVMPDPENSRDLERMVLRALGQCSCLCLRHCRAVASGRHLRRPRCASVALCASPAPPMRESRAPRSVAGGCQPRTWPPRRQLLACDGERLGGQAARQLFRERLESPIGALERVRHFPGRVCPALLPASASASEIAYVATCEGSRKSTVAAAWWFRACLMPMIAAGLTCRTRPPPGHAKLAAAWMFCASRLAERQSLRKTVAWSSP